MASAHRAGMELRPKTNDPCRWFSQRGSLAYCQIFAHEPALRTAFSKFRSGFEPINVANRKQRVKMLIRTKYWAHVEIENKQNLQNSTSGFSIVLNETYRVSSCNIDTSLWYIYCCAFKKSRFTKQL